MAFTLSFPTSGSPEAQKHFLRGAAILHSFGWKQAIAEFKRAQEAEHDHRGGVVHKSFPMIQQSLVGMGTGHMCDPHAYGLKYTINPSWELGFGIGHVVDGVAHLQFIPITPDYTCVVDGKVFKG